MVYVCIYVRIDCVVVAISTGEPGENDVTVVVALLKLSWYFIRGSHFILSFI